MSYLENNRKRENRPMRVKGLGMFVVAFAVLLGLRLFYLQVIRHGYYKQVAAGQQDLVEELLPKRGTIFLHDYETDSLVPAALSQDLGFVFAVPKEVERVEETVGKLVEILGLEFGEEKRNDTEGLRNDTEGMGGANTLRDIGGSPASLAGPVPRPEVEPETHIVGTELDDLEVALEDGDQEPEAGGQDEGPSEYERFVARLSDKSDPYEPIKRGVPEEALARLRAENIPGIYYTREASRLYPEPGIGGHVLGFVGRDDAGKPEGRYGIEGYFDERLAGTPGKLETQKDVAGRLVGVGERTYIPPVDGADVVLAIDRTIQFMACKELRLAVLSHEAEGGSVIIMDPKTGDVLALCGYPDFYPGAYGETEDINVFNNPVTFGDYEPGSVFKPVTMAAALDTETVMPSSMFTDTGEVQVGPHTIRNSDRKAHGTVTMTQVLEESLNTGMAYVVGELGNETFQKYVQAFGFGEKTGVPLQTEVAGDISNLAKSGDIFAITASFGQGLTVTPIQMAQAYAAIANGGVLVRPRLVTEVREPDGFVEKTDVQEVRRVMSSRAARLLGAMLVSVVEEGHGRRAGVEGYYIAGKTGTAQVAREGKYAEGETIGSFAGFGPVEDPRFVMVTRVDNPKNVSFAESTAAPLFGTLAEFLLEYLDVAPSR